MPRALTILVIIATLFFFLTPPTWAQSPTETETVQIVATTVTHYYTETPAASALSTQYTSTEEFRTSILNATNFYRYEHSAPFLYWNTTLAEYAQRYSRECLWKHSANNSNGENLARGYSNVTAAVQAWGDERSMYDFDSKHPTGFTEATGHFTQLVWQSTYAVGCGWTDCDGQNGLDGVFLVCEYWPPGNLIGQNDFWFKENVKPEIPSDDDSGFNVFDATKGATGGTPSPTSGSSGATSSSAAMSVVRGQYLMSMRQPVIMVVLLALVLPAIVFGIGLSP